VKNVASGTIWTRQMATLGHSIIGYAPGSPRATTLHCYNTVHY